MNELLKSLLWFGWCDFFIFFKNTMHYLRITTEETGFQESGILVWSEWHSRSEVCNSLWQTSLHYFARPTVTGHDQSILFFWTRCNRKEQQALISKKQRANKQLKITACWKRKCWIKAGSRGCWDFQPGILPVLSHSLVASRRAVSDLGFHWFKLGHSSITRGSRLKQRCLSSPLRNMDSSKTQGQLTKTGCIRFEIPLDSDNRENLQCISHIY